MGSSRSSRRELVHGFSDRPRAGAAVHAGGVNFGVMHGYPLTAWYAAGGSVITVIAVTFLPKDKGYLVQTTLLVLESASAVARIVPTELLAPDFSRMLEERIKHIGQRLHVSCEPFHLV